MSKEVLFYKIKKLLVSYFRLFGLYILFFICVALLQSIFPYLDLQKYSQDGIFEILKENKLKAFFAMVIFAPFIEELMFRTLLRPKTSDLILFLTSWSLFLTGLFITIEFEWYYRFLLLTFLVIVLFFSYKKVISNSFLEKAIIYLNKHRSITLQVTSIIFGFLHIFNYVDSFRIDSILFLLIVPRIIAGHMFGKIKIENNHMIWPILLHAINNGVVFLIISSRY
ncbi:CPBP family intramembrane metalloprotease [Aquimarina sp. AD1]|uniref:CPBP family glutamic-type intramembrane protease n=1 Tax=Aquimarina sp. (strain AD1) TaxID=1714848 RepID=UPI000E4F415A|nr:CPBP family glutamic-type intramembrane protease [Aquimarina sp. AD1]AXT55760.1 CPBP family intramembrane metalloprotease [Aquimarina sp. AD1]RKN09925.1 CPBP family intramembrane metalloprotease [Aquimarina sp. AD1]